MKIRRETWAVRLFAAACLFLMACMTPLAPADEYDTLRSKWLVSLTGGPGINLDDTDVAAQVMATTITAQTYWDSMRKEAGRTTLWDDLASLTVSGHIRGSYLRLKAMALAYATTGSPLQEDPALAADIVSALDWLYTERYNETKTVYDNWWDWEIGTPLTLSDIMVLMYGQMNATQIANYIKAVDRFNLDPTMLIDFGGQATGANRLDKALAVALRGVVSKSSSKLLQARDAMSQVFLYVTSGDGFYEDGSFIQHSNIAYTGSYGRVLISDVAYLFYLLNGSSWAVTDPNAGNVYRWVTEAFQPFVYHGAMMDSVCGRAISRQTFSDHIAGRTLVGSLLLLARGAPADKAAAVNGMVKGWAQRDTTFANYADGMGLYKMKLLKALLANPSVLPSGEPVGTHVFAGMDRVLHRTSGFAFGLSLFSNRVSAFEVGNGENIKGWWTGIGMTSLYNDDLGQFSGDYWPTVDSYRLPGTTTDGSGSNPVGYKFYPNTRTWAGGSTTNGGGAFGLDFTTAQVTGSELQGKKSWFAFGDRIVALGSGITTTDGRTVETIVENRRLNADGDNALTVNGSVKPSSPSWSEAMADVQWAHLAGNVPGADIGYHFPTAASVNGLRETRTGSWSQINSDGSTALVSNNYLSLALGHGANPDNASYAYVILPNRSVAQTAAYAAAPTIQVLENSADAHAVKDTALRLVGVNFWTDVTKTVLDNGMPYLVSNRKASVTTAETATGFYIGISDPTQANTGTIELEVGRAGAQVISADAGITVTQLTPTIKLSVNVNAAHGKTFNAQFGTVLLVETASGAVAGRARLPLDRAE